MSHKATNWLASLDAALLGPSEFRIMFHLCDCHNPSAGCFPTQAYLLRMTGVSNGTLNNALNSLEQSGLIQRHRERDGKSRRQKPTRYILGFEIDEAQKPSPENGVGAVSNSGAEPSPKKGKSRLQPTGEKPVKEPVINQREAAVALDDADQKAAAFWAESINSGKFVSPSAISVRMAQKMVSDGMVGAEKLRSLGIAH